jgi:integrase
VPVEQRGSVVKVKGGYGVRWWDRDGNRKQHTPKPPFQTKTAARAWWDEQVKPTLRTGAPSSETTFTEFAELFLTAHAANVEKASINVLRERLGATGVPVERQRRRAPSAIDAFGSLTLRDLEAQSGKIAAWAAGLPEGSRYGTLQALRQVLNRAVDWGYITRNPAKLAGRNPQPKPSEREVFADEAEVDRLAAELGEWGAIPILGTETALRSEEWIPLERGDVSRNDGVILVSRTYTERDGVKPYGKNARALRAVPLTPRTRDALDYYCPPRLGTRLLFPALGGGGGKRRGEVGHLNLHNWRQRDWYPAIEAAGLKRDGEPWRPTPYTMRHTAATWWLTRTPPMPIELVADLMGDDLSTVNRFYRHLRRDSADRARDLLNERARIAANTYRR